MPELVEDLTEAGIRFVYFSPRNMRRSKKVAEKMGKSIESSTHTLPLEIEICHVAGLQTDWNCAISLRPLDSPDAHDPHR